MHESLSLDLVPFIKQHVKLLAAVHVEHVAKRSLYEGHALQNAIHKYTTEWLPDLDRMHRGEIQVYQPTLDVCWVWHLHKLNPTAYFQDCVESFGRNMDVPYGLNPFEFSSQTQARYHYDNPSVRVSVDLVGCAKRQVDCFWKMRWAENDNSEFLRTSEEEYVNCLARNAFGTASYWPTPDVQLIWNTHMAFPAVYASDINRLAWQRVHESQINQSEVDEHLINQIRLLNQCEENTTFQSLPTEPKQSSVTREEIIRRRSVDSDMDSEAAHEHQDEERIVSALDSTSMHIPLIETKQRQEDLIRDEDVVVAKAKCSFFSCFLSGKKTPKTPPKTPFGAQKLRPPTPTRARGHLEFVKGG